MLRLEMKDWKKHFKEMAYREQKYGMLYVMGKTGSGKTTLVEKLSEFGISAKDVFTSYAGFEGDLTRIPKDARIGQIIYLTGHYKGKTKEE